MLLTGISPRFVIISNWLAGFGSPPGLRVPIWRFPFRRVLGVFTLEERAFYFSILGKIALYLAVVPWVASLVASSNLWSINRLIPLEILVK